EQRERGEDREVEAHRHGGQPLAVAAGGESKEDDAADGERAAELPGDLLVARRSVGRVRDLRDDERRRGEPHDRDPPLEGARVPRHARDSILSIAQAACSSTTPASTGSASGPPTLPRATIAFRLSHRGSLRGT